jgi:hypothetical protein
MTTARSWKFVGRRCHKTCYVDAKGNVVLRPTRRPSRTLVPEDFLHSINFSLVPPFLICPACPCGNPRCRLIPKRDGKWDGQHLWKFKGWRCQRVSYVDSQGKLVPIPRGSRRSPLLRPPILQKRCSQCGRIRTLNRQYRPRLGSHVAILSCSKKASDPVNLTHDPPEYFRDADGEVVPLSIEDLRKLRGRSRHNFAIPVCDMEGCPRRGKPMELSSEFSRNGDSGEAVRFVKYRCRPMKPASPHQTYCVAPRGEIADRLGKEWYRWQDAETGQVRQTTSNTGIVGSDRVMPQVRCKIHDCLLRQLQGPWGVQGSQRRWKAVCPVGGEPHLVWSDGTLRDFTKGADKWYRRGRHRLAMDQRQDFIIGQMVDVEIPKFEQMFSRIEVQVPMAKRRDQSEVKSRLMEWGYSKEEIAAKLHADRPLSAARWLIAIRTHLTYEVVKKYHTAYRRSPLRQT